MDRRLRGLAHVMLASGHAPMNGTKYISLSRDTDPGHTAGEGVQKIREYDFYPVGMVRYRWLSFSNLFSCLHVHRGCTWTSVGGVFTPVIRCYMEVFVAFGFSFHRSASRWLRAFLSFLSRDVFLKFGFAAGGWPSCSFVSSNIRAVA